MPSATIQEYLEAIYKLSLKGEVRPTQLAEVLAVSGPTVTATMRRLEAAGLVTRPDGGDRGRQASPPGCALPR
jgi:Mn-dependent DtxR family transcriptional regulator